MSGRHKSKNAWKKQVKIDQDFICPVCGKKGTNKTLDIHHKKPKSKKGTNVRDNVVAWHRNTCHRDYHREHGLQISDDYGNPI